MTPCPRCDIPPDLCVDTPMRVRWYSYECPKCGLNRWVSSTRKAWAETEWEKAVERLGAHLRTMEEIAAGTK